MTRLSMTSLVVVALLAGACAGVAVTMLLPRVIGTHARFVFVGGRTNASVILGAPGNGPTVTLFDVSGTARASLDLSPLGYPLLTLNHPDGSVAVRIGAEPSGSTIALCTPGGKAVWSVKALPDGTIEQKGATSANPGP
ncbi:MAG: hypothetical protein H6811_11285 [Phycisphaeraceae bacterium]|nr:hypothetical protein [Phycisphaeraceae bacterium]